MRISGRGAGIIHGARTPRARRVCYARWPTPPRAPTPNRSPTRPRSGRARPRTSSGCGARARSGTTATRCAPSWFPGAMLNTCYNAVDRHVRRGRGEQTALIYDSPVTGTLRTYSYAQLRDEVARLAGALLALGVARGDRVLIYMPMVPEAVFGMLACARIGAIHSVVFGGFAASELAQRIQHAAPAAVLTASCGIEPGRVVAVQADARRRDRAREREAAPLSRAAAPAGRGAGSTPGRDVDWQSAVASAAPAERSPVQADRAALHPLHVRHHGHAEGRGARQRRPRRRAQVEPAQRLRDGAGRRVLGRVGHRLGGRALLHRLRAAPARLHDGALRGQAGRHARRGRVLPRDPAAPRECAVHRADRDPRDQARGSARRARRSATTRRRCARSSSPASAPTPTPSRGASARSACP